MTHGTRSGYTHHGCGCADCRAAHAAYVRSNYVPRPRPRADVVSRSVASEYTRRSSRAVKAMRQDARIQPEQALLMVVHPPAWLA
jgi:hypothetical protein